MGVDTKGKISRIIPIEEIKNILETKLKVIITDVCNLVDEVYRITFTYEGENRKLSVIYDDKETNLVLGHWGSSVKIMKSLIENYGGSLQENDHESDWVEIPEMNYYPLTPEQAKLLFDRIDELENQLEQKDKQIQVYRELLGDIKAKATKALN